MHTVLSFRLGITESVSQSPFPGGLISPLVETFMPTPLHTNISHPFPNDPCARVPRGRFPRRRFGSVFVVFVAVAQSWGPSPMLR